MTEPRATPHRSQTHPQRGRGAGLRTRRVRSGVGAGTFEPVTRAIRLGLRFALALAHGRPNGLRLVLADTVAVRTRGPSLPARSAIFRLVRLLLAAGLLAVLTADVSGQTNVALPLPVTLNVGINGGPAPDVDMAIQVLLVITLLSLAPSILLLMTCFMRIAIVLSFVRTALSLQSTPANQVIIGLSLFLTLFIMAPTWERIDAEALAPYRAKQITGADALTRASMPVRSFMLRQARPKDVELFVALAKLGPTAPDQLPLKVVIPGFIISELRTAFQMGFLLFVPFILIDLVVATVLMSMGMMMMPPVTVSLPLKILLFVLVDGWNLVVRSVVLSFGG